MASSFGFRPLLHRVCIGAAALVLGLAVVGLAAAQDAPFPPAPYDAAPAPLVDWSDQIPAHLARTDGIVQIERDGTADRAEENLPLLAGDRLYTDRSRAEIIFGDGTVLDVDEATDLDLLSDTLIRLGHGRIRLLVGRAASGPDYRIDAAGTTTFLRSAGEYELLVRDAAAVDPEVRIKVIRGSADFSTAVGSTLVTTGAESRATARRYPSTPYRAIVASVDTFDRWIDDLRYERSGVRSAQYLPDDLRVYGGAFDRYGDWAYERGYGYVWYPRVGYDWRPYYDGRWTFVGAFGWTWIGGGAWTWPTHHYGRWGHAANRWFWIPGRQWAPAWVSWAGAPGYVSWCPLGYDNRPVFSVSVFSSTGYRSTGWPGWTVVPSNVFVTSFSVRSYAVAPRALAVSTSIRFTHRSAPARPHGVVATSASRPVRAGTRTAVPRGTTAAGARASASRSPWSQPEVIRGGVRSGSSVGRRAPESAPPPAGSVALPASRVPRVSPPAGAGSAPAGPRAPSVRSRRGGSASPPPSAPPPGRVAQPRGRAGSSSSRPAPPPAPSAPSTPRARDSREAPPPSSSTGSSSQGRHPSGSSQSSGERRAGRRR